MYDVTINTPDGGITLLFYDDLPTFPPGFKITVNKPDGSVGVYRVSQPSPTVAPGEFTLQQGSMGNQAELEGLTVNAEYWTPPAAPAPAPPAPAPPPVQIAGSSTPPGGAL